MTDAEPEAQTPPPRKRASLIQVILAIALGLLVIVTIALGVVRFGVHLPQARQLIEARAEGLKIGRIGRLHLEGVEGDIWRDATVRRLTIADAKGVWLEARDLRLVWRYPELFQRRFHAERITAREVRILRRPVMGPAGKPGGGMSVSVQIDALQARLELLPAFSYRRGVYDVKAGLDIERSGRRAGQVAAASQLHPGDRLDVTFDLGKGRAVLIKADAVEAEGGALAGALGLPAEQAFRLQVDARGETSQGRFTADAVSGAGKPLWARGGWAPGGGQAAGRLDLTASRLTADIARRLGPEVIFAGAGRKTSGPEGFALDLRARAPNLGLTARGFGDLGKRRTAPQGLLVEAASADLSKLGAAPMKGPARVTGRLAGDATAWRFKGQATANSFVTDGYSLAKISGPLDLARKDGAFELATTLQGAGGAGRGYAAAILGGAPRATLTAARLKDGRLLVRDLDVVGRGLKVEARGERTLLGGLDFHGQAQLSNLSAARPGASGAVQARWSAVQGGAERPWVFKVDANGERFAAGLP